MGLDIGVGDESSVAPPPEETRSARRRPPRTRWGLAAYEPRLTLEDDGYYWHIQPLFEPLSWSTGQRIDFYDDAAFAGADLDRLAEVLKAVREDLHARPATWQVRVGTVLVPEPGDVFATVERAEFLRRLDRWERIVARARELGRPVLCLGD